MHIVLRLATVRYVVVIGQEFVFTAAKRFVTAASSISRTVTGSWWREAAFVSANYHGFLLIQTIYGTHTSGVSNCSVFNEIDHSPRT